LAQVIRCLLIDPNPESALNDEAGRLLLEAYDDFAQRARMMTDLYAGRKGDTECDKGAAAGASESAPKKRATDKKKNDRKKSLKRL
jgi:ubiquitin-conjugating enzyme E2 S